MKSKEAGEGVGNDANWREWRRGGTDRHAGEARKASRGYMTRHGARDTREGDTKGAETGAAGRGETQRKGTYQSQVQRNDRVT